MKRRHLLILMFLAVLLGLLTRVHAAPILDVSKLPASTYYLDIHTPAHPEGYWVSMTRDDNGWSDGFTTARYMGSGYELGTPVTDIHGSTLAVYNAIPEEILLMASGDLLLYRWGTNETRYLGLARVDGSFTPHEVGYWADAQPALSQIVAPEPSGIVLILGALAGFALKRK